jgi:uracil phosphoribosyltransferase
MAKDIQHVNLTFQSSEINHLYGENIHILSDPFLMTILGRFCSPTSRLPLLNDYLSLMYRHLLTSVVNVLFSREQTSMDTRMKQFHEQGVYEGDILKKDQRIISVDLARAGTFPSHLIFHELNFLLDPENLRQDHIYINRKTNEKDEVIGVDFSGSKIGGDQDEAIVLFPDPMGATGVSLSYAINHYKKNVGGKARKYVAMHLIITPEYIDHMIKHHPDVEVFALRLDRGLSDQEVLDSIPGSFPGKEKGLNEKQYIVPGAGGIGEILNNSYI